VARVAVRLLAGCAVVAALVATTVVGAGTAFPATASTEGGCLLGVCSETTNLTDQPVGTALDWCARGSGPCPDTGYGVLSTGRTTPAGQDWDTFFVAASCTYSGLRHPWGDPFRVDGGDDGVWVQVHDDEHYFVQSITC
jgi:hypothetical protein